MAPTTQAIRKEYTAYTRAEVSSSTSPHICAGPLRIMCEIVKMNRFGNYTFSICYLRAYPGKFSLECSKLTGVRKSVLVFTTSTLFW